MGVRHRNEVSRATLMTKTKLPGTCAPNIEGATPARLPYRIFPPAGGCRRATGGSATRSAARGLTRGLRWPEEQCWAGRSEPAGSRIRNDHNIRGGRAPNSSWHDIGDLAGPVAHCIRNAGMTFIGRVSQSVSISFLNCCCNEGLDAGIAITVQPPDRLRRAPLPAKIPCMVSGNGPNLAAWSPEKLFCRRANIQGQRIGFLDPS